MFHVITLCPVICFMDLLTICKQDILMKVVVVLPLRGEIIE